jgi:hypothetical protein
MPPLKSVVAEEIATQISLSRQHLVAGEDGRMKL